MVQTSRGNFARCILPETKEGSYIWAKPLSKICTSVKMSQRFAWHFWKFQETFEVNRSYSKKWFDKTWDQIQTQLPWFLYSLKLLSVLINDLFCHNQNSHLSSPQDLNHPDHVITVQKPCILVLKAHFGSNTAQHHEVGFKICPLSRPPSPKFWLKWKTQRLVVSLLPHLGPIKVIVALLTLRDVWTGNPHPKNSKVGRERVALF